MEKVQRIVAKIVYEIENLSYMDKCAKFGIQKLEQRRIRGNLIQKFKLEIEIDRIKWLLEPIKSSLRGKYLYEVF